jgi:geranylgeranyl reductase
LPKSIENMMNHFEIIIVGAGPAGLRCAEILAEENKKVLLLEKNKIIGDKICAAGLTRKSLELMDIPKSLFEYQIDAAVIRSSKHAHGTKMPGDPVVFMIDRVQFGQWQADKLKGSSITIKTDAKVTAIRENSVEINNHEQFTFDYLVGADGANSFVRKHLKLPSKRKLVTLQYKIPDESRNKIEIHLISKYFHSGYAWVFPHKNYLTVGCSVDPKKYPVQKLKKGFQQWLKDNNFNITNAKFESFPINFDYRGYLFSNIFLVGEAAGLASGLTGEGIYQALVSGEEVAKTILNPEYKSEAMNTIIKYNKIQLKIYKVFVATGIFRESFFNLVLKLIKSEFVSNKISNGLS